MSDRLIGLKEVESKVGFKKSKIYALMDKKLFPQKCIDGRQALWSEAEVDKYIETVKQQRQQKAA